MADIKVRDLADTTMVTTDNEIMVLTDSGSNQVKNITINNLLTNVISANANNVVVKGSDNKLFVSSPTLITGSLSNLTTSDNTNLVAAINELNTNIGDLNDLQTQSKISTVAAINELNTIVDPVLQYDAMNMAKGMLTDDISTNSIILSDVTQYAHSLFDSTHFTASGNAAITLDGIATANSFSQTNFISSTFTLSNLLNRSWSITSPVLSNVQAAEYGSAILQLSANGFGADGQMSFSGTDKTLTFTINTPSDTNPSTRANNRISISKVLTAIPDKLQGRIDFNYATGEYKLYYNIFDGNGWQLGGSVTPTTTEKQLFDIVYNSTQVIYFERRAAGSPSVSDVIDLKYFNVITNGVSVFSGNQTGMDTLKPNDFTTVGTPTLTNNSIVSDLTTSDYLIKSNAITIGDSGEFRVEFSFDSTTASDLQYILDIYNSTGEILLRRNSGANENAFSAIVFNGGGSAAFNYAITNASGHYYGYIEYKNGVYTYNLNGQSQTLTTANKPPAGIYNVALGVRTQSGTPASALVNGSINLNLFRIYVDGKLVYQPVLNVPYNKSKTGSKIADSAYRPQIESLYNENGYAPYYTLDEVNNNFTLPMGEIYGMMLNQSTTHVVERYSNSTSGYRVWSDGLIEQWGDGTTTNGTVTVSLLLPYSNTDYKVFGNVKTMTIKFNAHTYTTTDFTVTTSLYNTTTSIGTDFNWYAIGY